MHGPAQHGSGQDERNAPDVLFVHLGYADLLTYRSSQVIERWIYLHTAARCRELTERFDVGRLMRGSTPGHIDCLPLQACSARVPSSASASVAAVCSWSSKTHNRPARYCAPLGMGSIGGNRGPRS